MNAKPPPRKRAGPGNHAAPGARRKGARTRASIPPEILQALNEGREETITLVEYLAVDQPALLSRVLDDIGVPGPTRARVLSRARPDPGEGVMRTMTKIAAALDESLSGRHRERALRGLSSHRSDIAREWAALLSVADPALTLAERLEAVRPFASDHHMAVREVAWVAFRPFLEEHLDEGLRLLAGWAHDADPNVRRFASEVSRPRGVWTKHLAQLKADPQPGLVVLEPLRSDPSRYVQASVGNWLNDASKSRPDWVESVCARWLAESATPETAWIVRRARRSMVRAGGTPA